MPNKWTLIDQPNLYGFFRRIGNLKAEVVRAYPGDWRIFLYRGEHMVQRDALDCPSYARSYPTHLRAKEAASRLLATLDSDENVLPINGTGTAPR